MPPTPKPPTTAQKVVGWTVLACVPVLLEALSAKLEGPRGLGFAFGVLLLATAYAWAYGSRYFAVRDMNIAPRVDVCPWEHIPPDGQALLGPASTLMHEAGLKILGCSTFSPSLPGTGFEVRVFSVIGLRPESVGVASARIMLASTDGGRTWVNFLGERGLILSAAVARAGGVAAAVATTDTPPKHLLPALGVSVPVPREGFPAKHIAMSEALADRIGIGERRRFLDEIVPYLTELNRELIENRRLIGDAHGMRVDPATGMARISPGLFVQQNLDAMFPSRVRRHREQCAAPYRDLIEGIWGPGAKLD